MDLIAKILKTINDRLRPYQIVLATALTILAILLAWLALHGKDDPSIHISQQDNSGVTVGHVKGDFILNKFDEETSRKIGVIYNNLQEGKSPSNNEPNPAEKGSIFAIISDLLTTTDKRRQPIAQAFDSLTQDRVKTKLERAALLTWSDANESYRLLKEATELDPENMHALNQLGHLSSRLGKMDDAQTAYQQGLALARRNNDLSSQGAYLGNLGVVFRSLGDYAQAKDYHQQALAISTEIGDKQAEGADLGNLGLVSSSLGDYAQAREHWQQALVIFEDIGSPAAEQVRNALKDLDKQ